MRGVHSDGRRPQPDRRARVASAEAWNISAMTSSAPSPDSDNSVFLRGRLAAAVEFRDLASGDILAVFRVTVARPSADRARVDSIECASARVKVHRSLSRAEPGDEVEVTGALHRRFWRTPNGAASRYAVDVTSVRVNRAGRRAAASRGRTPASA
jgi:single-strand DNA-binding protein